MAFEKKTWKDRIAEFPTRRRLTKEDNTSELVTVAREEGTLSQEGDAFSADNMNDLENRIDKEFTAVNGKLELIYKTHQISATESEQTVNIGIDGYKAIALRGWSCVQKNVYCTELYLSSDAQLVIRANGVSIIYISCLYILN